MTQGQELHRYTVRETSPQVNSLNPDEPIYWHWSVEARSPEEAECVVRLGTTGGFDQTVVPPLG
ncbi:hypothetical protein [Bradyrhizobium sp. SZCCHNR2035]|uniref:hypothetical protein n=1 Tax=Bradyrhizobium sp. SZCCHNR2035 TaxID=3057386 RepID=UPI0029165CF2|nr:hypothetical protein [Bradyrhizobium sp. SZCCHNR2035]